MPPPKEMRSYKAESEVRGNYEAVARAEKDEEEEKDEQRKDKKRKQRAERDDRDRSPLAAASSSSGALVSTAMAAREPLQWRKLAAEGLDCDYCLLLPRAQADALFRRLEDELEYFQGDLTRIFVYGKWHDIPRQQVSFGDEGLSYKFSGTTVPARPWPPALLPLRDLVRRVAGVHFNFVLVNRYRDGRDHIGEHRDDEADLERGAPIASVSLGQTRAFVLRHGDARRPGRRRQALPPVKIDLEHGSLLMMNYPTNRYWYHSLPPRKSSTGVRLNLTFRKMAEKAHKK